MLFLFAFILILMHACLTGTRLSPATPHTHENSQARMVEDAGESSFRSQVLRSSTHLNRTSPFLLPFARLLSNACGHHFRIRKGNHIHAHSYTLTHTRTHAQYVQCADFSVQE